MCRFLRSSFSKLLGRTPDPVLESVPLSIPHSRHARHNVILWEAIKNNFIIRKISPKGVNPLFFFIAMTPVYWNDFTLWDTATRYSRCGQKSYLFRQLVSRILYDCFVCRKVRTPTRPFPRSRTTPSSLEGALGPCEGPLGGGPYCEGPLNEPWRTESWISTADYDKG